MVQKKCHDHSQIRTKGTAADLDLVLFLIMRFMERLFFSLCKNQEIFICCDFIFLLPSHSAFANPN